MLVEDDGVSTDPFEVKVAVVVRGDEVIADFTGSSPQVRGPMNCTFVVARLGRVQRRLLRHRPADADPAQLRLLPADAHHRPGRAAS